MADNGCDVGWLQHRFPIGDRLVAGTNTERTQTVARTLDLSAFPDPELDVVKRMVARAREWADQDRYVDVQGECSDLLYSVTAKLWPHRLGPAAIGGGGVPDDFEVGCPPIARTQACEDA